MDPVALAIMGNLLNWQTKFHLKDAPGAA